MNPNEPIDTVSHADTVLRDALLGDRRIVDVHVTKGRVSALQPSGSVVPAGAEVHELQRRLLLPAMAEPHAHLDKALIASTTTNETGDLAGAIEAMGRAAASGRFSADDLGHRASRAVEMLISSGVTAVRTHVNVGEEIGAAFVSAIDEVRADYADLIEIQIVSLTHTPLTGVAGAGNRRALAAALAAGADLVGCCPHLDSDGPGCIGVALEAALDARVGVDLHMDENLDPNVFTLVSLAKAVIDSGFPYPVAASHCVSLSMQPLDVQRATARLLAEAGIAVIPLPQTNLYLQGWAHPVATPRGLAPIDVLLSEGVMVAAGGDNVQDPFNPIGRCDPLETAALLVLAGHQLPDVAYRMVSNDARQAMGLQRVEFAAGDPADFIAVPARSPREAIAAAGADRMVFRLGRLTASTSSHTTIHR